MKTRLLLASLLLALSPAAQEATARSFAAAFPEPNAFALYDASGVARDELPYSEQFEEIWSGFQNRTFKNAEREQVFGAILKYVRSSSNSASGKTLESKVSEDQLKQLKSHLPRHARGAKLLPYSDEFEAARKQALAAVAKGEKSGK